MKELIEATQLIGQPDAGIFVAPLYNTSCALYFGDAEIVDENEYNALEEAERENYYRLDGQWVLLGPGASLRLTQLDVRVSVEHKAFYFAHSTLWERRFG